MQRFCQFLRGIKDFIAVNLDPPDAELHLVLGKKYLEMHHERSAPR